jgi:hypothetical protein
MSMIWQSFLVLSSLITPITEFYDYCQELSKVALQPQVSDILPEKNCQKLDTIAEEAHI